MTIRPIKWSKLDLINPIMAELHPKAHDLYIKNLALSFSNYNALYLKIWRTDRNS